MFYTVRIAIKPDFRIPKITIEQNPLVIDYVGESGSGTLQQPVQIERNIVTDFFRLVQTVYIQQVVE